MSVVANFIGSLQKPRFYAFANTSKQTVYTVSAGNRLETVGAFSFANDTAGAIQCKLYHYETDAPVPTEYLVWTGSVPANSTTIVESNPIRLRPNDEVRAIGAASVTLKLSIISQLETGGA